ncbi:MAG: hypothetical protein QMC36_05255 [Patescibacteria group bacterium]
MSFEPQTEYLPPEEPAPEAVIEERPPAPRPKNRAERRAEEKAKRMPRSWTRNGYASAIAEAKAEFYRTGRQ